MSALQLLFDSSYMFETVSYIAAIGVVFLPLYFIVLGNAGNFVLYPKMTELLGISC